jgi:hypothetical protein
MNTCEFCNKSYKRINTHQKSCREKIKYYERVQNTFEQIERGEITRLISAEIPELQNNNHSSREEINERLGRLITTKFYECINEKLNLFVDILIYEYTNRESVKYKNDHICSHICFMSGEFLTEENIREAKYFFTNEYEKMTDDEKNECYKNCTSTIIPAGYTDTIIDPEKNTHSEVDYVFYGSIIVFLEDSFSSNIYIDEYYMEFATLDDKRYIFRTMESFYELDRTEYNWRFTREFHFKKFYKMKDSDLYNAAKTLHDTLVNYSKIDSIYKAQ